MVGGPGPLTCPVPGWETSCPALSWALGMQQAPCPGMGSGSPALSRLALSAATSGRARRWRTLLLPVPALLRPTLRANRNVWSAQPGSHRRISPPHPAAGTTRSSGTLSVRKRSPRPRGGAGEAGTSGAAGAHREERQARERERNIFGRNLESPLPGSPVPHTLLGWGRVWPLMPRCRGAVGDKNPSGGFCGQNPPKKSVCRLRG